MALHLVLRYGEDLTEDGVSGLDTRFALCLPITPSMQVEAVRSMRGRGAREYDCRSAASSADAA